MKSGAWRRHVWYYHEGERIIFEHDPRTYYTNIAKRTIKTDLDTYREYKLEVAIPCYGLRTIRIQFHDSQSPQVFVDGPVVRKHRFPDNNSLCMWYPDDPRDKRWVFEDGLVKLIQLAVLHVFRECWFVEKGEWPGPEVQH